MKFIGYENGQCVLLAPWVEVRPVYGTSIALTVGALTQRYNFQFPPSLDRPWQQVESGILEFRDGYHDTPDGPLPIKRLALYSDGIAIECSTTDLAKVVLEDALNWAQNTQGFRPFERPPRQVYGSSVVVEFERPVEELFKQWGKLQKLMSSQIEEVYGIDQGVSAYTLRFKCDPMSVLNANMFSEFLIERVATEKFTSQRFFCSAPLPTKRLIALLEAIESLIY